MITNKKFTVKCKNNTHYVIKEVLVNEKNIILSDYIYTHYNTTFGGFIIQEIDGYYGIILFSQSEIEDGFIEINTGDICKIISSSQSLEKCKDVAIALYHLKNDICNITVVAKEWFDNINGNSYFANQIILNKYDQSTICFQQPFKYVYENEYKRVAYDYIIKLGFNIKNAPINYIKITRCTKKEVLRWGKEQQYN